MSYRTFAYWNNEFTDKPERLSYAGHPISAMIGWAGIQIFDENINLTRLCLEYAKSVKNASCGQCAPCRIGIVAITNIFEKALKAGKYTEQDISDIENLSYTMSQASMCDIGRLSPEVFLYLLANHKDPLINSANAQSQELNYHSIVTAPCKQACPIHLDVPKYIEAIKYGRFLESYNTIYERLPLPGCLGRVCFRPCEHACTRNLLDEPLQIKFLKRFVADVQRENALAPEYKKMDDNTFYELSRLDSPRPTPKGSNGIKVAIIGAGPAGLTCAYFLAFEGYDVTVFEALPVAGGMGAVGIPKYRLPEDILKAEEDKIVSMGVKIKYNMAFGRDFSLADLENEGFKAIFVSIGCHCFKNMGIEGENENYYGYMPGVVFLRNISLGQLDEIPKGKRVAVIGGGNVAIDCVRSALRVGFEEAMLLYRRSRDEMPADDVEVEDALAEGVQMHFLTAPKKIHAKNGKVTGIECVKMTLGDPDASGRRRPKEMPNSNFIIETDAVIAAIGQESDVPCLYNMPGVEISKYGTIIVDENLMTTKPGVFAGGDCVLGPDMFIRACAQGRKAAKKIDNYLQGGSIDINQEELDDALMSKIPVLDANETIHLPAGKGRIKMRHLSPDTRKGTFAEVELGFSTNEAIAEANRCLRCYRVLTVAY